MNLRIILTSLFSFLKSNWHLGFLFVAILCLCLAGSYYENETDIFFLIYSKGLLTPKPLALPETFILQIFIGDVMAFLYTHFPHFEWYDCLTLSFLFFIGILLFNIFALLKNFLAGNKLLKVAVLFFFTCLFLSTALMPEITRHSFLIVTLAFVVFFIKLVYPDKVSPFFLISCYSVFLFSVLRRPEPAIVLTFLFSLYLLLLSFEGKIEIKRAAQIMLPCLLMLTAVFAYTHIPRTPEGMRYLKIVPYENTLVDFKGNLSDLYLLSKEDTVKYQAASHFFFCDTKHLNEDFFRKIGIVQLDKSPSYLFQYVTRTSIVKDRWTKLIQDILESENGLFLLCVFISALWLFLGFKRSAVSGTAMLLFLMLFSFTFLFANLFMKVENKVNESLLLFLILMLLTYLINFELIHLSNRITLCLSVIIVTCIILRGYGFCQLYQVRKNDAQYVDRVRQAVNNLSNSLIVFNITCWDEISIRLFDNDRYNPDNIYISFDNGVLYLYDEYNRHIRQVTGQSEFIKQVDFVVRQPHAYWFSSEARMRMITEYVNVVYKKGYVYSLVKEIGRDEKDGYQSKRIGIYKLTSE